MAIYVDLQPDPQFDESLVRYCVINFNRFQYALRFASKRIQTETLTVNGPWPQDILVTVPYLADVVIWGSIGHWATAATLIAYSMTWNGVNLGMIWDHFWNETSSGKTLEAVNILRSQPKGLYTLSQRAITGGLASDTNSRLRLAITYYEV